MGETRLTVVEVAAKDIPTVWPRIRPLVHSALKKAPGWKEADLVDVLLDGEMALWLIQDQEERPVAVLILRLVSWPQEHVLEVFLAGATPGADIEGAITSNELRAKLQAEAERLGARRIQAWMRPGLAKLARGAGWRKTAELMTMEI